MVIYLGVFTTHAAPSGPPTNFHVVVLNCTAVEAQWDLPRFDLRNGIIRGYKLFLGYPYGADIRKLIITGNTTVSFIVSPLRPSTTYSFSILAYTVGDGPRSIHLSAQTRRLDGKRCCNNNNQYLTLTLLAVHSSHRL